MSLPELHHPAAEAFDDEPCAMPHEHQIRALLLEQDMERARLRGRILELEEIIDAAGLVALADDGTSMRDAYYQFRAAVVAVLDYFDADPFTVDRLPAELRDVFRPLVIT